MLLSYVRGMFVVYCALFMYRRIVSASIPVIIFFTDILVSLLSGLVVYFIEHYVPMLRFAVLVVIVIVYVILAYKQPV